MLTSTYSNAMKKPLKLQKNCTRGQVSIAWQAIIAIIGIILAVLLISMISPRLSISSRLMIYSQSIVSTLSRGENVPVPPELYENKGKLIGVKCDEGSEYINKMPTETLKKMLLDKCLEYDYVLVFMCCNSTFMYAFEKEIENFELNFKKGVLYYDRDSKKISIKTK